MNIDPPPCPPPVRADARTGGGDDYETMLPRALPWAVAGSPRWGSEAPRFARGKEEIFAAKSFRTGNCVRSYGMRNIGKLSRELTFRATK